MSGSMKPCFPKTKTHRNKDYVKQSLRQNHYFYYQVPPHIEEAMELIKKLQEEKTNPE
ncbi:hypothetical protein [uncultured Mediterranean phage uvMED]|nr:hypothetical protein [uncultured Mediterranean phage uvMED]